MSSTYLSELVNDLRQGRSSFFTLFCRSSLRPGAELFRIGMKMLVTILSMFQSRFSGTLPSTMPRIISLWKVSSPRALLLELLDNIKVA